MCEPKLSCDATCQSMTPPDAHRLGLSLIESQGKVWVVQQGGGGQSLSHNDYAELASRLETSLDTDTQLDHSQALFQLIQGCKEVCLQLLWAILVLVLTLLHTGASHLPGYKGCKCEGSFPYIT